MKLRGSIALVTGANRGLGLAFTQALLDAGAAKVYAAARDPSKVILAGATRLNAERASYL
jgi:NAD(P)-dependent dehydrogenase (short-subunit alcohol dehydrogenase family)